MALDDIKKLNEEINKLRAELGRKPLKPFDVNELEKAKALFSGLSAEVREMGNDLDYVSKSFKDSVNELSKQNTYLSDSRKALNGISNISSKILDYRRGETSMDEKTLQNLQKKAIAQFRELERIKAAKILGKENQRELEEALKSQDLFRKSVDDTIAAQKDVNKEIGLLGTGIEGISKGLSKMGFGNLSQPLTEAIEKTKNARLQQKLNNDAIAESKKLQEANNKELKKYSGDISLLTEKQQQKRLLLEKENRELEYTKESLKDQNNLLSTQTSKYKNIGKALLEQVTYANLLDIAITQILLTLKKFIIL
jgi:chromosome segregation ATPase